VISWRQAVHEAFIAPVALSQLGIPDHVSPGPADRQRRPVGPAASGHGKRSATTRAADQRVGVLPRRPTVPTFAERAREPCAHGQWSAPGGRIAGGQQHRHITDPVGHEITRLVLIRSAPRCAA
jgi:hypothetical protein